MSLSIIWSPRAKITFYNILEYLEQNWTQREITSFIVRTDEVLNHVRENPQIYPYSKESDTFRCVIREQVSLFYRIKNDQIELVLFWDNRRNPSKLRLK